MSMMAMGGGNGRISPPKTPIRTVDSATRKQNLRRVAGLFRPYWKKLVWLSSLIVLSAGLGMVPAFLTRDLIDAVFPQHHAPHFSQMYLAVIVIGMVTIPIVTGIIGVAQTWSSNRVGQEVMHDLRASVYRHLQRLSLAFFTRTRTGEVQSRIANDIGGVDTVVTTTATSIASNVTTVIATAFALVFLDWRLALAAFALLPVFVLMTRKIGRVRREIAATKQGSLADISSLVEESLSVSGVLLGKTMGKSGELTDTFSQESRRLAELEMRQRMAGRWMMASIQATFSVMPALVYGLAGYLVFHGNTSISAGTLVAFTGLQTRLFFPVGSLLNVQADVQTSLALFDRVFEYLDLPVDIDEVEHPVTIPRAELKGEVVFDDVSFAYEENQPTLQGISFVAEAGTRVAIVGETGSGKTTLGYLVARLYDVTSGSIRIDDVDVRELSFKTLREAVGVVSQETYLFHGTVMDNLRFARPGATDEEVYDAARAARIHDHLMTLPGGYETIVGERGYRFSGGEKQRMAIARAILRDPPILVLDEATSALDVETERAVAEALDRLSQGRTTIAIAHRLSTVRDADQILVLDAGRLVERGTHAQLVAQGGRYAALVDRDAVGMVLPD